MSVTNNYGLYKPAAGESGCADELNTNLDQIDGLIKSNADALNNHKISGTAHPAANIYTAAGSNVETALGTKATTAALTAHQSSTSAHSGTNITSAAISGFTTVDSALVRLNSHKSDLGHTHEAEDITVATGDGDLGHALSRIDSDLETQAKDTGITSTAISGCANVNAALQYLKTTIDTKANSAAVTALQNLVNLLDPDLTGVTVTTDAVATAQGIHVTVSTTPAIYVMRYNLLIKRNGSTVFNGSAGASYSFVFAFGEGDTVEITPTIYVGTGYKVGTAKTITWHNPNINQVFTMEFEASGTTKTITESAIQALLGWSAANGQSVNKAVNISCLHRTSIGNYTLHSGGFTLITKIDNSVEHLDSLTLTGLTDKDTYAVQFTATQISTK